MHTPDTPERDPQKQHGLSSTGYGVPTSGYETSDVKVGGSPFSWFRCSYF